MKQFEHIATCLFLLLVLCSAKPLLAQRPIMHVYFEAYKVVTDKETGDTIKFLDTDLFSLPDTTYLGNFFDTPKSLHSPVIDVPAGTQFIVRVRTCQPREWNIEHEKEEMLKRLENYIKNVQGQHETLWLGPYTVPDTTNTPEGAVRIKLPKIQLSRPKTVESIPN